MTLRTQLFAYARLMNTCYLRTPPSPLCIYRGEADRCNNRMVPCISRSNAHCIYRLLRRTYPFGATTAVNTHIYAHPAQPCQRVFQFLTDLTPINLCYELLRLRILIRHPLLEGCISDTPASLTFTSVDIVTSNTVISITASQWVS